VTGTFIKDIERTEMSLSVLIADDDASLRDALAKALQQAGFAPLLAANGSEAVALHEQRRPNIVLLDLNMPIKNGWDVFQQITAHDPLTPVIIVTGRTDQLEFARMAGVGALMEKPVDVAVLIKTIVQLSQESASIRLSRFVQGEPAPLFFAGNDPTSPQRNSPARQHPGRSQRRAL
jgi:DNA-binding response OmpR family regulator